MLLVAKEPERFTGENILFLIHWYSICCPSDLILFIRLLSTCHLSKQMKISMYLLLPSIRSFGSKKGNVFLVHIICSFLGLVHSSNFLDYILIFCICMLLFKFERVVSQVILGSCSSKISTQLSSVYYSTLILNKV